MTTTEHWIITGPGSIAAFNRIHAYLVSIDPERSGWGYSSSTARRPIEYQGTKTTYLGLVIHLVDSVTQTAFRLCADYTLGLEPYPSDFGLHKLDSVD